MYHGGSHSPIPIDLLGSDAGVGLQLVVGRPPITMPNRLAGKHHCRGSMLGGNDICSEAFFFESTSNSYKFVASFTEAFVVANIGFDGTVSNRTGCE